MKKQQKSQPYIHILVISIFVLMAKWLPREALAGPAVSTLAQDAAALTFGGVPGLVGVQLLHNQQQGPDVEPFRPPAGPTKEAISASKESELRSILRNFLDTAKQDMNEELSNTFIIQTRYILNGWPEHIPIVQEHFRNETRFANKIILALLLYTVDPNNLEVRDYLSRNGRLNDENYRDLNTVRCFNQNDYIGIGLVSVHSRSNFIRYHQSISKVSRIFLNRL